MRPGADAAPLRYTATFTFARGAEDAEFHALDQRIAAMARALPGYLGEEAWENAETGRVSTVYHWSSLEALQALVQHPDHREAKRLQSRWLAGYRVEIAAVLQRYGDDRLADPAPVPA